MASLPPQDYKSLQIGLINESAVAENKFPVDAVSESINFHFDKIGCATLRKGTTLVGNAISGDILGLYNFRDSGSGTNNQLISVNGSIVYYLSGTTWTSKRTGLTSGSKARFTTFLDFVWMVNGTEATAIWNGDPLSGFVTSGNAADAPTGKYIENFRSRVWIAGNSTYPDRLFFSSLPTKVTTPVVTWDTSVTTGYWIDISPSDGENITGLKRDKNALLVFKPNNLYRVYSISESEPDPKINIGTYSQESIVRTKDGVYFHHSTGFYKYADGNVQEISKPIIDIVDSITLANFSKVCGLQDGDHICWAVGNVTYKGVTYTNMVVRYTISTQGWTHYQYPTQFLVSADYNDDSTLFKLIGDDSGNILKINVGKTDNGSSIFYSLIHPWTNLDGFLSTEKNLNKALFSHLGGAGSNIQYQVENDEVNNWSKSLGQLKNGDTGFDNAAIAKEMRFRIAGASVGEPFEYYGYEIFRADNKLMSY